MLTPSLALVGVPPRLVELPVTAAAMQPDGRLQVGAVLLDPWSGEHPLHAAALARLEGMEHARHVGQDPAVVLLIMPRPERIQAWGPHQPWPPGWQEEDVRTWLLRL